MLRINKAGLVLKSLPDGTYFQLLRPDGTPLFSGQRCPYECSWEELLEARAIWEANQPKRPVLPEGWQWVDDSAVVSERRAIKVDRNGCADPKAKRFIALEITNQIVACVLAIRELEARP